MAIFCEMAALISQALIQHKYYTFLVARPLSMFRETTYFLYVWEWESPSRKCVQNKKCHFQIRYTLSTIMYYSPVVKGAQTVSIFPITFFMGDTIHEKNTIFSAFFKVESCQYLKTAFKGITLYYDSKKCYCVSPFLLQFNDKAKLIVTAIRFPPKWHAGDGHAVYSSKTYLLQQFLLSANRNKNSL